MRICVSRVHLRVASLMIGCLSAASAFQPGLAQSALPTNGITPEHDYATSAIDSVDLDSGNLILDIPILTYKQRGSLPDFTLKARYNATNWAETDQVSFVASPTWIISYPGQEEVTTEGTQSILQWAFFGTGVQVVRGDTLVAGSVSIPITLDNDEPGEYVQNFVEDGSATQHLLYLQTGSSQARAMDGSGIAQTDVAGAGNLTTVFDASGNSHTGRGDTFDDGFFDTVSDPLGNSITPSIVNVPIQGFPVPKVDHWVDSIGRSIPAPPGGNLYIYPGCYTYRYPTYGNTTSPYTFCYSAQTFSSAYGLSNISDGGFPAVFLSSIQLPNGTSYTFSYTSWGELQKVGLPTGGNLSYGWGTTVLGASSHRYIQSRTIDPGDGTPLRTWTYCWSSTSPCGGGLPVNTHSMIDPDGNETQRGNVPGPQQMVTTATYQGQAANGVLLQSTTKSYCNGTSVFFRLAIEEPTLVCQTTTTLSDGETSAQTTTYDTPTLVGDPIVNRDSNGYVWGNPSLKSIGIPVAQTLSGFATSTAGPILQTTNVSYLWQTDQRYLQANLLSSPSSVSVGDGSGNVLSQTLYGYDENNGSPQGVYGERTSVASGVTSGVPTAKTTAVYNGQGMVTDTYDANSVAGLAGNHIHLSYDPTGLFPSAVMQSPTSGAKHLEYYSYDTNTGNLQWHTDQNGSAAMDASHTSFWSFDVMGRATSVSFPDGGGANFCYTDSGGATCSITPAPYTTYMTSRLSSSTVLTSRVSYNGIGEPVLSVGPDGATTATQYDLMGRVHSISNPYVGGSPAQWTSKSYDALSRQIVQTNPDNTTLTTSYSGSHIRSTDEAGNSWLRTYDALSRLTAVTEPNAFTTSYNYDPLGNLLGVTQGGGCIGIELTASSLTANLWSGPVCQRAPSLVRTFTYDSLSRLITSNNPETGTVCYGLWNGSGCKGGYDPNGNMLYRSDANGTPIAYTYDALNRVASKTAPDAGNTNFYYTYDQGANGIGRLSTEVNPNGTAGTQYTYDFMGRVKSTQWFHYSHQAWEPGVQDVEYDLAGNLTQITYPDGRVVSQSFNGGGHLSGVFDGPLNAGGAAYFSNAQYWPSGSLQSVTYGNHVSQGIALNSRLQPCHTMASTPILPANVGGGNLYDRASYFSGGALGPEPNCGTASRNNGNIYSIVDNRIPGWTQSFTYDSLNRLTGASRSDGGYNHTYNYDSFGNMLPIDNLHTPMNYGIDSATNRMILNGDLNSGDLRYYPNGELGLAPSDLGGYHSLWYTAEGYLRSIDNYGTGSYLYNGNGERTLAVRGNQTASEYVYLNGQALASYEATTGVWTDYIYANGQKIAQVNQQKPLFHLHGTRDGSINMACGVEGPWYGAAGGVPILPGDLLAFDFLQTIPSYGGLALIFTDGTGSGDVTDTSTGVPLYFNGSMADGQWHHLTGSLNEYGGKTAAYVLLGIHNSMPAGTFDMNYANPVIVHANGSVTPLWVGGSAYVPGFSGSQCGGYNLTSSTDLTPISDTAEATNYYLLDHLSTTQMEIGPGGWPLWQGQFTPFGQEIVNGQTNNLIGNQVGDGTSMRYKFTGKERDSESGLDYFGARMYGSSMGRFTSTDPVALSRNPENPQSWNKYSYVFNNPLLLVDPDGKWPTWYHTEVDRNFFGNQLHLSMHDQNVIINQSASQDGFWNGGQLPSNSVHHGMQSGFEWSDPVAAIAATHGYINSELNTAVDIEVKVQIFGDAAYGQTTDEALKHFANALHATQDLDSPEHGGKPWFMDPITAIVHSQDEQNSATSSIASDEAARQATIYDTQILWDRYQDMLNARLKKEKKNISGEPNQSKDTPQ